MVVGGYYESQPIVLATWPGQEEPVLIDGHTRRRAAIAAGIREVLVIIEEFSDEDGALQYVANLQTKRRPTDDWVRYQLITELDKLMDRGGDRRSDQAKSKGPRVPIETTYSSSAERTAALVGCSARTVKRARKNSEGRHARDLGAAAATQDQNRSGREANWRASEGPEDNEKVVKKRESEHYGRSYR